MEIRVTARALACGLFAGCAAAPAGTLPATQENVGWWLARCSELAQRQERLQVNAGGVTSFARIPLGDDQAVRARCMNAAGYVDYAVDVK